MTTSPTSTTTAAIPPRFSWKALAEKRHKEGKVAKAFIGTASIAIVSVISLIAFSFIPIIPLIVMSCLGLILIIAIVVAIPLFVFFISDSFGLPNSTESGKKTREKCPPDVKKIIDESSQEIDDNPEKNDDILNQASKVWRSFEAGTYLEMIREEIKWPDSRGIDMLSILNFDNNFEDYATFNLQELESGLTYLEVDLNYILGKLHRGKFTSAQKKIIRDFVTHMNAAFELFSRIDIETPPLNEARVLFNIINTVRSKKSDADHQIIKEKYKVIDALFAYSKFLLGKALMQKQISETKSRESS
jgi:hypothetical protein